MDNKVVVIIVSILLPPLAVFLKKGAGQDLIINIVLTLLGSIPGIIHALWLLVYKEGSSASSQRIRLPSWKSPAKQPMFRLGPA